MNQRLVFSSSSQSFRVSPIFFGLLLWMTHASVTAVDFLNDDSDPNSPVKIEAQQINGRPDREITLEKDAKVDKGNSHIEADDIYYDIVDDKVKALGHVFIDRAGDKFTGNQLQLKMDTGNQPPKNKITFKELINSILEYSPKENKAKLIAEYSTL